MGMALLISDQPWRRGNPGWPGLGFLSCGRRLDHDRRHARSSHRPRRVRCARCDWAGVWHALAVTDHFNPEVFLVLLAVVGVGFGLMSRSISIERSQPETPVFEDHDLIVVALLAAIALRSALWSAFEWVLAGNLPLLLLAALAAGAGKLIGGALADRLGWRRWTIGALAIAAPLLVIGPGSVVTFLIGLALLQSVTPVALATVAKMLPGRPGVAAGLSSGLPIAVGGLFVFGGLGPFIAAPLVTVSLIAGIGAVMWWGLRRGKIEPTAPKPGYHLAGDN